MPIAHDAPDDVFRAASYMCETYYRQHDTGVLQLVTTAASNRNGNDPRYWDVWRLPGANVYGLLPYHTMPSPNTPQRMGTLAEFDPRVAGCRSIRQYIDNIAPGAWYRQSAGYSMRHTTLDHQWRAVDLYHQPPGLIHNPQGIWVWYVLMDCIEPEHYHVARITWQEGMRDLGPEDVGSGPQARMRVITQQVAPPYMPPPGNRPPYPAPRPVCFHVSVPRPVT